MARAAAASSDSAGASSTRSCRTAATAPATTSASARSSQAMLLSAPCGLTCASVGAARARHRPSSAPIWYCTAAASSSSPSRISRRPNPCRSGKPGWAPMPTPAARGERHGTAHDERVAGVKAAGDVGRIDRAEQPFVVAHRPRAEGLAEVGVQVQAHGSALSSGSSSRPSVTPSTRLWASRRAVSGSSAAAARRVSRCRPRGGGPLAVCARRPCRRRRARCAAASPDGGRPVPRGPPTPRSRSSGSRRRCARRRA